jgi:hypothetical protein
VIHQNVGTKADYGLVGFVKKLLANFLVFPKPLGYPAETKIVGIKYEQITEGKPKGPLFKVRKNIKPGVSMREKRSHSPAPERDQSKQPKPEAPPKLAPKRYRFRSELKITATQILPVEVEASSASEASKLTEEKAAAAELDLAAASVQKTVSKPKKINATR